MRAGSTVILPLVAVAAIFVAGCASSAPALALAPVGPPQHAPTPASAQGTLLVYSAFNTGVPSPNLPDDIRQHSDYELRSPDGRLLQVVSNHAGFQSEDPAPVPLPAGNYRITARANGYGLVNVPVVIAANQVTTVHLEGGAAWPDQAALNTANSVRLPHGEVVGWKAVTEAAPGAGNH